MIPILTRYSGATHQAQTLSSQGKVNLRSSSTASERSAAHALATRYYGAAAADTLEEVKGVQAIDQLETVRGYLERSRVDWSVWTIDETAKHRNQGDDTDDTDDTAIETTTEARNLLSLPEIVDGIREAEEGIATSKRRFETAILPDIISLGVYCLAAQEHHALPAAKRGQGRKSKSLAQRASDFSDPTKKAPDGFLQWVKTALPDYAERTIYKYMTCALGLGLTAHSTGQEARKAVADALQQVDRLTLGDLERQGKLIASGETPELPKPTPPSDEQLTFRFLNDLHAQERELDALADRLTGEQKEAALNTLLKSAERISGLKYGPIS